MQKGIPTRLLLSRSARTSFAGLGTAFALGVTAMAAASPLPIGGPAPTADAATRAIVGSTAPIRENLSSSAGAVASATETATTAASQQPAPAPVPAATVDEGHFGGRGLAVALAAAGQPVGTHLERTGVVAAAEALGIELNDPINQQDVAALAKAAWRSAPHQWTLAGIGPGDAADASDIVEAAERLGVKIDGPLQPTHVSAVLSAGRADVVDALAAAGFSFGRDVTVADLEHAAAKLGHDYGEAFEAGDAKITVWMARDKVKRAWEAKHPSPVFAKAAGLALHLPSHRVHYAGFHQASYPVATPMARAGDAKTQILPSRGRGTSRASAIDIVQAPGEDVRAPVSGRVVEVTHYKLYGKYSDVKMRIRPKGANNYLVTVLHMDGAKVKVGDRVEAGMTVIADGPRKFPFFSQVDAFSGTDWGHVHIELRRG